MRFRFSRGGFWNSLTACEESLTLGRWPLGDVVVRREVTRAVGIQKTSLPLWWRTDVRFDTDGPGAPYIFVPFRPRLLEQRLRAMGWPVERLEDVRLSRLWRRGRSSGR